MDKSTEKLTKEERPLANIFFLLFFLISLLNLGFNFLGSPAVKFIYLAQVILVFFSLFLGKRENYIWIFILFSIFEGQGRILWSYNPFFRLVFDIFLALMVVKELTRTKKILDREIIPKYLIILISIHLIWFFIEVFNPMGPDIFTSLATSKYYIFPLFLFFLFKSTRFDFSDPHFQKNLQDCLLIIFLVSGLVVFQTFQGEELLFGISMNYLNLQPKFLKFIGNNFRPWGTSFIYGGMGTLFYCSVALILLYNPKTIYRQKHIKVVAGKVFKWGGLGLLFYASFLGQVRSATLKTAGIVLLFFAFKFLGSRVKARLAITLLMSSLVLGGGVYFSSGDSYVAQSSYSDGEVNKAVERWEGMLDGNISSHRAGLDIFLDTLSNKVEFPLGYGLGMTQSFLPGFEQRRRQLPNIHPTTFWHLDNLIVFLFLEIGIGAFFYLAIIGAVLISLFSRMFTLLKWQEMTAFTVLTACCSSTLVIVFFNWGAVSLPFNPESFYFWLWSALGFSTFYFTKKRRRERI